jgi:hypothetical protein
MIGVVYQNHQNNVLEQSPPGRHGFPNQPPHGGRKRETRLLTVGNKLPAFRLTSVVGLEKNKEFQEIAQDTYPGR